MWRHQRLGQQMAQCRSKELTLIRRRPSFSLTRAGGHRLHFLRAARQQSLHTLVYQLGGQ